MSIPVLAQTATELRRLAIAGAPLAKGDFRVKRLIEPLQASGQKAPVFTKVAQLLQALIETTAEAASERLLKAITLVNAILYTQGQTGVSGELEDLPDSTLEIGETAISARRLMPVIEALKSTGAGRLEVVTTAHKEGLFNDPRLVPSAVHALGDHYGELADLITNTVVPSMGPMVLPLLKDGLDFKGDRSHARRLLAIAQIEGQSAWDLYLQALDEGNAGMRVAGVTCLATFPDAAPVLKDLTKDKSGEVREAALAALAEHKGEDVVELLLEALCGKDYRRALGPAERCQAPEFVEGLLAEIQKRLAELKKAKKENSPLFDRVHALTRCLVNRSDDGSIALLIALIEDHKALAKIKSGYHDGEDLIQLAADSLIKSRHIPGCKAVQALAETCSDGLMGQVIAANQVVEKPDTFFDAIAPIISSTKRGTKKKAKAALATINYLVPNEDYERALVPPKGWDDRWLDLALEQGHLELVSLLMRPGHAEAEKWLRGQLAKAKETDKATAMAGLMRGQIPDVVDVFCGLIEKIAKAKGHYRWWFWYLFHLIPYLPVEAIEPIEATAVHLSDNAANELVQHLEPLRAAREAAKS